MTQKSLEDLLPMTQIRTALIVGGGIAGMTAAVALARQGVEVQLLELHNNRTAGAAITIQNRAIDALAELDLLDQLISAGRPQSQDDVFRYYDGDGNLVATPPMPPARPDGLPNAVVVHRIELARILQDAAVEAGVVIRIGVTVSSLHDDGQTVTAELTDGTTGIYDLVVGADGVRSTVRSMILGDDDVTPTYSGTTMFRLVSTRIPDVGPSGFYQHGNILNVLMRLQDGSLYLATGRYHAEKPGAISPARARDIVRDGLAPCTAPLPVALRERLDGETLIVNDYDWILAPDPWARGRTIIIGDAAHSTAATMASGGGLAIEDGVVLGQEVGTGGSIEEIVARFMQRRFARARLVVETSVQLGEMLERGDPIPEQNAVRSRAMSALNSPY